MKIKDIQNSRAGAILWDSFSVLSGAVLFAMSVNLFYIPGNIVLGGATGIATLAHYFFHWRIGAVIMIVNLPLILINARLYGIRFCIRTLIGTAATSVLVDTLDFFPVTITDPLLCCRFRRDRNGRRLRHYVCTRVYNGRNRPCRLVGEVLPASLFCRKANYGNRLYDYPCSGSAAPELRKYILFRHHHLPFRTRCGLYSQRLCSGETDLDHF